MLKLAERTHWDLPFIVEKMAHNPAICFQIKDRGYLREGYYADLVLLNPHENYLVKKADLLYKCAWSPFEGIELKGRILSTFVNGKQVYDGTKLNHTLASHRLEFNRTH